ncbi:MBL fold metallo-hydrolase [Acinetobacter shaoyimingii]|uniref:MBL fold metallo-hydrolase n=1 Tax=Acinetobacter shaoyimingii TaxID=2715164 RepID=A0A6G8RT47_9GAMM|nr:MBL fold metallo-hydrolase [Acinetobacter shaoyimingii]QIO05139.1 MBL fold metallo-hydrolase [Acinetobacter shaoyimingii]
MIYNIHHLHCGSLSPFWAPFFGQKGLVAELVCHCLLLETDQGLVLVDTGIGIQDYLHPRKRLGTLLTKLGTIQQKLSLSALAQIQKLGFKGSEVKHILLTHLAFDHAGGISDFPDATVHVLSTEYEATKHLTYKNKYRYKPEQFKEHRHWNFLEPHFGDSWFNFQKVLGFNLFQDEIMMIPLPGATAGHCGIAIAFQDRWLLFCGDAYYSHLELNPKKKMRALKLTESTLAEDNQLRIKTLEQIQQLSHQHPEIEIICSHDPEELNRYLAMT